MKYKSSSHNTIKIANKSLFNANSNNLYENSQKIKLGKSVLEVSNISLGCMRMSKLTVKEAETIIHTALESGINFFDHADIYGGGKSEEIFAEAVGKHSSIRDNIIFQTKCGIRKGFFDFSKEHILKSVDESLKRLKTDYINVLLLTDQTL